MQRSMTIGLTRDEGVVLLEWLSRENRAKRGFPWAHQAEQHVVRCIRSELARVLGGEIHPDYGASVFAARARVMAGACAGSGMTLFLTGDEALVLLDWLKRMEHDEGLPMEHAAEGHVVYKVEGHLERVLVEPFHPDYGSIISAARRRVASDEES